MLLRILLAALLGVGVTQGTNAQSRPLYRIQVVRGNTDTLGDIVIRLFPSITPLHVRNFDSIVRAGRYDQTAFHRVIPDFVIQGGDPNSISGDESTWGYGDTTQPTVKAEFNSIRHTRGRVGMARGNDVNSATSQFYICHGSPTFLDRQYTVFGETVSGFDVIDTVALAPKNVFDRPLVKHSMVVTYHGEDTTRDVPPLLVAPAMNAGNFSPNAGVSFRWSVGPQTLRSIVALSDDSLFANNVLYDTVTTTSSSLPTGRSRHRYYWKVRGDNGGPLSDWSETWQFTTKLGWPRLLHPPDAEKNVPADVVLRWERVLEGVFEYRLQVATSRTFADSRLIVDTILTEAAEFPLTNLKPGTSYFWRVNSLEIDGETSGFSRPNAFSTVATTSVLNTEQQAGLQLRPIPVENVLTVMMPKSNPAACTLEILDVQGATRTHINIGSDAPSASVQLDCSHLQPGVYVLRYTGGAVSTSQTFVKY